MRGAYFVDKLFDATVAAPQPTTPSVTNLVNYSFFRYFLLLMLVTDI